MTKRLKNNQKGFTIVELMIASAVFAMVLLLITVGIIQVGKLFYKGTTSADTQEVARSIMADITSVIQFGGSDSNLVMTGGGAKGFCFGNKLYSYVTDTQLTSDNHVLSQKDITTNCADATVAVNDGKELMSIGMRLGKLEVSSLSSGLYEVSIVVINGDDDLIDDDNISCKNERGSQFCSVSELTTTVQRRK